jgi:hypothetical protein
LPGKASDERSEEDTNRHIDERSEEDTNNHVDERRHTSEKDISVSGTPPALDMKAILSDRSNRVVVC